MTQALPKVRIGPGPRPAIPPLFNGDHLDRAEFERRYDAMPEGTRAELIEGVVYMAPPVSHDWHGVPHFNLIAVLGAYCAATPGMVGGDNSTVRLDLENLPQPDVYIMIDPTYGGRATVDAEGYVEGAPELVAEIAATTANYDLHEKLQVYGRNLVREYLVWRTYDGAIDYFELQNGQYQPLTPAEDGLLRSHVFPGLWLDPAALIAGDLSTALQKLQQGLVSQEHQTFVDELKRRRSESRK